jgi:hypothetical protein
MSDILESLGHGQGQVEDGGAMDVGRRVEEVGGSIYASGKSTTQCFRVRDRTVKPKLRIVLIFGKVDLIHPRRSLFALPFSEVKWKNGHMKARDSRSFAFTSELQSVRSTLVAGPARPQLLSGLPPR